MAVARTASRRPTLLVVIGFALALLGGVSTLISILPALTAVTSAGTDPNGLVFVLLSLLVAALGVGTPVLLGLGIANYRGRRWLYIALAAIAVVGLFVLRPSFGTLGIWWMAYLP